MTASAAHDISPSSGSAAVRLPSPMHTQMHTANPMDWLRVGQRVSHSTAYASPTAPATAPRAMCTA